MTLRCTFFSCVLFAVSGCSCNDAPGGSDGGVDGATPGMDGSTSSLDAAPDAVVAGGDGGILIEEDGGAPWRCYPFACDGRFTECGDCIDNEPADGLVDSHDRDCLGPCDNTEGPVLLAGVGGEGGGPCKSDCYFDWGNGSGNDDCYWDHTCDPLSVAPSFDPEGPDCEYDPDNVGSRDCPMTQSDTCYAECRPLTPNGCDCFGCCTFDEIADRPASEGGAHVWIGSVVEGTNDGTCTLDDVTDVTRCRPCTPTGGECYNACERCELCIGRTELPPDCFETPDGGTPPPRCTNGEQPCGLATDPDCPMSYYCLSGCCVTIF